MSGYGASWAARVLVAGVAALLPAGVLSAATLDPRPSTVVTAGGRVGAAGVGQSGLVDEPGATTSSTVTVAPPTMAPAVPATTATTRSAPRPSPSTTAPLPTVTLPPGVPAPVLPSPTGIPNIPPASSWEVEAQGVKVRLRIEPASPVAGQPVTFRIDYSSSEPCCTVMVAFGDGGQFSVNNGVRCGDLSPGAHGAVATHTYASAGAYKATLGVIAALPCLQLPMTPGASPPPPVIHGAQLTACIGVGPGAGAAKGCSPFPDFGPDTIVSPVIDPACQVRSDCTKASTPRPGWNS